MDYNSIAVSALLGAIGGGVGHFVLSKVSKNKNIISIGSMVVAILIIKNIAFY